LQIYEFLFTLSRFCIILIVCRLFLGCKCVKRRKQANGKATYRRKPLTKSC